MQMADFPENPRQRPLLQVGDRVRIRRGTARSTNDALNDKTGVIAQGLTASHVYAFVRLDGDAQATMVRRDEVSLISAVERLADLADD